jgi:hypothetical protein
MISLQRLTHSLHIWTEGPEIIFLTSFWLFEQKEHLTPELSFFFAIISPEKKSRPADGFLIARDAMQQRTGQRGPPFPHAPPVIRPSALLLIRPSSVP